jgi:UDP-GlcNAc:undecaprenyl-phosphate GlcNAc-1-phosphate transferase
MIDFAYIISRLLPILPHFFISFLLAALLTPVISKYAFKFKAIDIKSSNVARIINTDIQENLIPRLGGLAVSIVFSILVTYVYGMNSFTFILLVSVFILTVAGFLDDIYDLKAWQQFLLQLIAVTIVVILAGVRIENIHLGSYMLDFVGHEEFFSTFGLFYKFVFPADIITIFWIMIIINAMNWVAGIDALEECMSIIAGVTLTLIAIKLNRLEFVPMIAIYTGALSGFTIFNLPPAKIYSGTIGNILFGFLLSVFAIKIDGKMTTSILLLAIPVVDFVWVLLGRLVKYKQFNPIKLMSISGNHHLHHRLKEMGFSNWRVLYFELSLFLIFASLAYLTAGFDIAVVAGIFAFGAIIILFAYLSVKKRSKLSQISARPVQIKKETEIKKTPDREYAY